MTEHMGLAETERNRILLSALEICRAEGLENLTIEAIAKASGSSAAAITDAWPSASAVVIDAFRREIGADFLLADTGDFDADLRNQLTGVARVFADPDVAPHLSALIGRMQVDPAVAAAFLDRVFGPNRYLAGRRFEAAVKQGQIRADVDLDTAIDLTFAPLWFRLLLKTGPLTEEYATAVAELASAALRPAD